MKKVIIIAMTLVMLLVSTGCSKRDETYKSSIEKTYSMEMEKMKALSAIGTIEDLFSEFYGGPRRGLKISSVSKKYNRGWVVRTYNPTDTILDQIDFYVPNKEL